MFTLSLYNSKICVIHFNTHLLTDVDNSCISFLRTSILYFQRTPSTTSDESPFPSSSQSLELDGLELSSSLPRLQPQRSKPKGKGLNPFTSSSTNPNLKGSEANNQFSKSLLQLTKSKTSKDGKEKKKKKGKGGSAQTAGRERWTGEWVDLNLV